jgi:hypothetical protein
MLAATITQAILTGAQLRAEARCGSTRPVMRPLKNRPLARNHAAKEAAGQS